MDSFPDMTVFLWEFPAEDFDDWRRFVRADQNIKTISDYRTMMAAIQADLERQGLSVTRVRITVREMEERLSRLELPNTPESRAAALAVYDSES